MSAVLCQLLVDKLVDIQGYYLIFYLQILDVLFVCNRQIVQFYLIHILFHLLYRLRLKILNVRENKQYFIFSLPSVARILYGEREFLTEG